MNLGLGCTQPQRKRRPWFWIVGLSLLAATCQYRSREDGGREDGMLSRLAGDYYSARVRFYPVEATKKGHHEFDSELGSYSREDLESRLAWLHNFRQRLLGVDATNVSPSAYVDWLLLTSAVKGEIYDLAEVRSWHRSPLNYSGAIRDGLLSLLSGESLSRTETRALSSRLNQIPSFLEMARQNIETSDRLSIEEGILELDRCRGIVEGLPAELEDGTPPRELAEIGQRSREAVRALRDFVAHLEVEVLPGATATHVLGAEALGRLLRYQEMEDASLEEIRLGAERTVIASQVEMKDIAARMEASPSLTNVFAMMAKDHLSEAELLPRTQEFYEGVEAFAGEHHLTSHVSDDSIQIIERPFRFGDRKLIVLESVTPLENDPGPPFFMLTVPRPGSPPSQTETHMRDFSTRALKLALIREVYPGKALYDSSLATSKSKIRKLLASRAHREGWGHYAEQLLIEQGYEWEDPLLRLYQLHLALIEQCRLIVAIDFHTGVIGLADAVRVFHEEAYLDVARSRQEARAVAVNPNEWNAGLGKLQILKLRELYLQNDAESKELGWFHDALLDHAGLPLALVPFDR